MSELGSFVRRAPVDNEAKIGEPVLDFARPIVECRRGHHNQMHEVLFFLVEMRQECDRLTRLTQALSHVNNYSDTVNKTQDNSNLYHLIGQNTVQVFAVHVSQPVQSHELIRFQFHTLDYKTILLL